MKEKYMVICDSEEDYMKHISEYIGGKNRLPFQICSFTNCEQLFKFQNKEEIELLLIAEPIYMQHKEEIQSRHIIVLNESGHEAGDSIVNISKYQSAEQIVREIMNAYQDRADVIPRRLHTGRQMRMIGNYTPVRRCLQTTFSLCMGQILAKDHKTLYLNFERYSGLAYMLNRNFSTDITDVMYYLSCEKGKLAYRLEGMTQSLNGLDLIPPVASWEELETVSGEQWISLFREIEAVTDYEYLILDLSEHIWGLFDILRECFKVYTITKEDGFAAAKIRQYETLLQNSDYNDVADKTRKWNLPLFRRLPYGLDQLTHGDLAEYVRKIIEEDLYG